FSPSPWLCRTGPKESETEGKKSRAVGEAGSQGKERVEERGNQHRGPSSDHNAGFWRAVGNKVGLPGSAPEKKSLNHTSPEDSEGDLGGPSLHGRLSQTSSTTPFEPSVMSSLGLQELFSLLLYMARLWMGISRTSRWGN
ncbi:hypothetical protein INR49_005587, partial [Caranx melampygus]